MNLRCQITFFHFISSWNEYNFRWNEDLIVSATIVLKFLQDDCLWLLLWSQICYKDQMSYWGFIKATSVSMNTIKDGEFL